MTAGLTLAALSAAGVVTNQIYEGVYRRQVQPYMVRQLIFDLQSELARPMYLNELHKDAANATSLECLTHENCKSQAGHRYPLILKQYQSANSLKPRLLSNSLSDEREGFDTSMNFCTLKENPDCLLRVLADWTPLCGKDADCKQPKIQVFIRLFQRRGQTWAPLQQASTQVLEMNLADGESVCADKACTKLEDHPDPCGSKSTVGYETSGAAICAETKQLMPCPAKQKLLAIDSSGQPVCISIMKKEIG